MVILTSFSPDISIGTVSQWMISVHSLGLKKHSLVLELAEVYLLFLLQKLMIFFKFQVPVVVIFTKFDALEDMCYGKLRGQGKSHEEASIQVPELANETFEKEYLPCIFNTRIPPKTYVCFAGNVIFCLIFQVLKNNRNGQRRKRRKSML